MRRIGAWSRAGLQEMYYFVHEPDDVSAPEMSEVIVGLSAREEGLRLRGVDMRRKTGVTQEALF